MVPQLTTLNKLDLLAGVLGSGKKGGMTEKQDIGNGHIGIPISVSLCDIIQNVHFRYIHS